MRAKTPEGYMNLSLDNIISSLKAVNEYDPTLPEEKLRQKLQKIETTQHLM